jgi:sulfur-carrier protein
MIKILYFGMLAERTGMTEETLDRTPGTVAALCAELLLRHPLLHGLSFRCAVDQHLVDDSCPIAPGAEVALLPPFAGG